MTDERDLETLLDLDGFIIEQVHGCWVKFEVRLTPKTITVPHGIRYSLTLHNQHGERIMGFDNAHAVKIKNKSKYQGRKTYDHRHRHSKDEGIPYDFVDAHQLIKDFWLEVDKILSKLEEDQ